MPFRVWRVLGLLLLWLAASAPGAVLDPPVRGLVRLLTRDASWRRVGAIPVRFDAHHPQGMVRIGGQFYVSSVEVITPTKRYERPVGGHDRDTGEGRGHLFKIDGNGRLLADLVVGEGTIYHPGGIDYDGTHIWVPVAEYRPNSRSILYRVDPTTMKAQEVFRYPDHVGAVVHDTDRRMLYGLSWGSRRFYRWMLDAHGRVTNAEARPGDIGRTNPSHYIDYQDCKFLGRGEMVCGGLAEYSPGDGGRAFALGGLEIVDLALGRPVHQVPVLLWTDSGQAMTRNPFWLEPAGDDLRAWFLPEDDRATIYVFDARVGRGPR